VRPSRHPAGFLLAALASLAGALLWASVAHAQQSPSPPPAAAGATGTLVHLVRIDGAIGVGTDALVREALADAEARSAELLVLELDTPGGLVASTRTIIKAILAARIPVAVYVAPSGARAASAGTYMAYAAHIAAMAPGTHLGAATPIQMSAPGLPTPGSPSPASPDRGAGGQKNDANDGTEGATPVDSGDAATRKMVNDAIAYLRSLAELRGRSIEWADKFVRDAATLTASEALKENVIDVVAEDRQDLLAKLDGRSVTTKAGQASLDLAGARIEVVEPDWRVKFLTAITNPNVAFILLLIGIYGIFFEFWSPGLTGPGVVGAISLILALYALAALPLSYAGLALFLLGIVLMIGEALAPGIGILGIGGVIAFIVGAIFLFDASGADIDLSVYWPIVLVAAATTAVLIVGLLGYLIRSRRQRIATGSEQLIGLEGHVVDWTGAKGWIRVHGELWAAGSTDEAHPGDKVRVIARDGLTLQVAVLRETVTPKGVPT